MFCGYFWKLIYDFYLSKTIVQNCNLTGAPRRGWDLWRFASLIPSGWRLTPIHKVMGDHASRGSTPVGAFLPQGSLCVIYFVPRKRFRQYRGCKLGHFVPKKRFNLHQMCVLHCSLYIIPYVSPRPRPVRVKTFSTHIVVKLM